MLNFLIYISEISLFVSIMLLFYRYLYFKLAYFVWSRYFFYLVLLAGITIPFLPNMPEFLFLEQNKLHFIDLAYENEKLLFFVGSTENFSQSRSGFINFNTVLNILFAIWLAGLLMHISGLVINFRKIYLLISSGEKTHEQDFILIKSDKISGAFSFFKWIFIGHDCLALSQNELQNIIKHEKIHAKQMHSVDNIVFELYRAFSWFNPVSKFVVANVKTNHEFIVDSNVTANLFKPDYSKLIVKLAASKSLFTVSNFSLHEIKNRIKILSSPESDKIRKNRFIMSLPVLFISIISILIFFVFINSIIIPDSNYKQKLIEPFQKSNSKIISPFFENVSISEIKNSHKSNENLKVSHREITYKVKSYSPVLAVDNGVVTYADSIDNWGIVERNLKLALNNNLNCEYKKLYKLNVDEGDSVKQGDTIGITGDSRLYRSVSFKLFEDSIPVNPEIYFKKQ